MLFSPKNPVSQIKRKKKRSFQIPDLSCWINATKKMRPNYEIIGTMFISFPTHQGDTSGQNWEERHLEWQIFIQPRHLAQIDRMMYIHMYRCIDIYVLCLYLDPHVCIDTCISIIFCADMYASILYLYTSGFRTLPQNKLLTQHSFYLPC